MSAGAVPILRAENISRSFYGVKALDNVSLKVQSGEVLAVIGENGAGKSTLMKILAGAEQLDEGQIFIEGAPVTFHSPMDAIQENIILIHQELSLVNNLSLSSNIFLGRELNKNGILLNRQMQTQSTHLLKRVALTRNPSTLLKDLSPGEKQQVEIARALAQNAKILIFDEPTTSLSLREVESLFSIVSELKKQGVAIIYISHRLNEVKSVADRVICLRDGVLVGQLNRSEISRDNMVQMMIGRALHSYFAARSHTPGEPILSVEDLTTAAHPAPLSLTINSGEIIGIAGLVGSGRTELLEALFGLRRRYRGTIRLNRKPIVYDRPAQAICAGVVLAPEDRSRTGVILDENVRENLSLPSLARISTGPFRSKRAEDNTARSLIEQLNIKAVSPEQSVRELSGGNQQKILFGKWLPLKPHVYLLDEPTRGVDIAAKHEIYQIINTLADQGSAVLFASSDMEEILGMAERIYVMASGRMAGELQGSERTERNIMQLATSQERPLCALAT